MWRLCCTGVVREPPPLVLLKDLGVGLIDLSAGRDTHLRCDGGTCQRAVHVTNRMMFAWMSLHGALSVRIARRSCIRRFMNVRAAVDGLKTLTTDLPHNAGLERS